MLAKKQVWLGGIWGHKWCYLGHLFWGEIRNFRNSKVFWVHRGLRRVSGAHFGWPTLTFFDLVQHKRL